MIQLPSNLRPVGGEGGGGPADTDLLMAAAEMYKQTRMAMMAPRDAGMVPGTRMLPDAGGAAGPMNRPGVLLSDETGTWKDKVKKEVQERLDKLRGKR